MSKYKSFWKWILCIVVVLSVAMVLLIVHFMYITEYKIADIDSSVSDDGRYNVLFQHVGEPDFPFGNSHARLVLMYEGKIVEKRKFDVANDGKMLDADNWTVNWTEDAVEVVISGEEQQDKVFVLQW